MVPKKIPFQKKKYKQIQKNTIYARLFSISHSCHLRGACTRCVFKFCLRNQSAEKGSEFKLSQLTTGTKRKRKKLCHTCIQFQESYTNIYRGTCRYLRICSHLLKKFLKKISLHVVSMSKKNSLCLELRLKEKSKFQKIIFLRGFDFDFDTYFAPF